MAGNIPVGGMETDITLNGAQPVRTLKELRQAVTNATSAWKAQRAELSSVGKSTEAAKAKFEGLKTTIDKQKEYISGLTREQKNLVDAQKNVDRSTEAGKQQYAKYGEQIAKSEGQIKRAETRLTSLTSQQSKAKDSLRYYESGLAKLQNDYKNSSESSRIYISRLKEEHNLFQSSQAKMNSYRSGISNLTEQLKKQEAELKRVGVESGKTSDAYRRQEVRVNKTGLSLAELKNKQKDVRAEFNKFHPTGIAVADKAITKLKINSSKLGDSLKSSFEKAKVASAALATGIAGVGAFAIKGAKEAGSLQKTLTENTNLLVTSGEKTKDVTKEVAEMQKDGRKYSIQYAESQQNIAEGYQELIKRGYDGRQSLGAMKSILQASKASGDSFADTMQVTTSVLEAFGMRTSSTAGMLRNTRIVANKLAMAADATSTDFKSLGIGMNYVGTSAKTAGVSLTETASVMGVLSNSGLEAQQAGTGLRKILISLQTPSKAGAEALAKYGMSVDDFKDKAGNLKPISTIFKEIADHVPKADRSNFFHNVFGTTGQNAAAILATNTKELDRVNKQVSGAYKNDYVGKLANKNMKATKNQQKQFHEAMEAVQIDIGSAMMPALSKASTAMVKVFNRPSTMKGIKKIAEGVGTIANKIADFISWIGKGDNFKKVTDFGKAMLTAFASYKVISGIAKVKRSLKDLFDDTFISKGFSKVGSLVKKEAGKVGKTLLKGFKKLGPKLADLGKSLAKSFSDAFNKSVDFSKGLFGKGKGAGKLTGLLQSGRSAGGFKNLTTAGKIGTGLAGAGVAIDAGASFLDAYKNRHSADKRSQDIGKGIGAGIGGGIGLWFGGPAGALIGSQIGKVIGGWAGIGVNKFTKGWQSKKPPKSFWSIENFGWSTKSMFGSMGKGIDSFFKSIGKNRYVKAFQKGEFFKVSSKDIHKHWKDFVNQSNKDSKKFYKDFNKNWGNFWKSVNSNRYVKAFKKGKFFQTAIKDMKSRWKSFSNDFGKKWSNLWKGANSNRYVKAFQKGKFFQTALKDIQSRWSEFKKTFGKGWNDFWKGLGESFKSFGKSIKDNWTGSINNIIGGFNDVVHAFGGGKKTVDYLHFANGTNWKNRYGVPAVLNDGNDSPETGNREGILNPDGSVEVVNGRFVKRWLFPGQDVIKASDMAKMFSKASHFASGTIKVNNIPELTKEEIKKRDKRFEDLKNYWNKTENKKLSASEKKRLDAKNRAKDQRKQLDKLGDRIAKALKDGNLVQAKQLTTEFNVLSKRYSATKKAAKKPEPHAGKTLVDQGLLTGANRRTGHSTWISNKLFEQLTTAPKKTATQRRTRTRRKSTATSDSYSSISNSGYPEIKQVKALTTAMSQIRNVNKKVTVKVKGTSSVKALNKAIKTIKGVTKKVTIKVSGTQALKALSKTIKSVRKQLSELTKSAEKNKFAKEIKSLSSKSTKDFKEMVKSINKESADMVKNTSSKFSSMQKKIETSMKSINSGVTKLAKSTATGFDKELNKMVSHTKTSMKKMVDTINDATAGVNKVISSFGGNSNVISKIHLATGTGYFGNQRRAITKPTLAVLNDGHDSPETGNRETIYRPSTGQLGIVQGVNVPTLLNPGDEVFNASESKMLGLTHFASGTGYLKRLYKQAKIYNKKPTDTLDKIFNFTDSSRKALKSLIDGSLKKIGNQAVDWWGQLWKMVNDKINDGNASGLLKAVEKYGEGHKYVWGAYGPTTFDCSGLVLYALKKAYGISYPHFSGAQYDRTQHISKAQAKSGDLVFWGSGGSDHVGVYAGGNKYFSAQSPSQGIHMNTLDSVVGKGSPKFGRVKGLKQGDDSDKVKADTGLAKKIKNQVGKGFWKTISKIADEFGTSSTGIAGKPSGDHSHWMQQAGIPKKDWDNINYIVTAESSWNPRATNGNHWGMGQMSAENMHYYSDHGNKWNPIAQLMGIMDYIKDRYGTVEKAVAFRKAHNWYANGGIANKPSIFGEAGPEMAVPLVPTKATRAWELIGKAVGILSAQSGFGNQPVVDQKEKKEEQDFRQAVLLLLERLVNKDNSANITLTTPQGRTLWEVVEPFFKENQRSTQIRQRRGLSGGF